MRVDGGRGHSVHRLLHIEALTATALAVDIRVVELEALRKAFDDKVDVRAVEHQQGLGVDQQARAVRLEAVFAGPHLVGKLEGVGQPGAAYFLDADAQRDAHAAFVELAPDLRRGSFCQCDVYVATPLLESVPAEIPAENSCSTVNPLKSLATENVDLLACFVSTSKTSSIEWIPE